MKSNDWLIILSAILIVFSAWVYFQINSLVVTVLAVMIILIKIIDAPRCCTPKRDVIREIRDIQIPKEVKRIPIKPAKPAVKKATTKKTSKKTAKKTATKKTAKKKVAKKKK